MRVEIFDGDASLGRGDLVHLDPPMGIAFGPFTPSADYDRTRHANTVNGTYIDDFGRSFRVNDSEGREIKATVAIEDWTEALGIWQATVFFADGNDFRAIFSSHEEYKAYYPNSP